MWIVLFADSDWTLSTILYFLVLSPYCSILNRFGLIIIIVIIYLYVCLVHFRCRLGVSARVASKVTLRYQLVSAISTVFLLNLVKAACHRSLKICLEYSHKTNNQLSTYHSKFSVLESLKIFPTHQNIPRSCTTCIMFIVNKYIQQIKIK